MTEYSQNAGMPGRVPAARRASLHLRLLNIGHFYDHWFMLIYATAVISMTRYFDLGYGEMMALSTPGFAAFGLGAVPAGWLGDRWSRSGMMTVFFIGLGVASILVGLSRSPLELAMALTLLGLFAAIYHPVAIAMVAEEGTPTHVGRRLGVNGVWGNMGVAGAAVITGICVDLIGWRSAFLLPGALSVATGLAYWSIAAQATRVRDAGPTAATTGPPEMRIGWQRVLLVVALTTILASVIFNGATIAMPKVLEERIATITMSATGIGAIASGVYAVAAFSQIVVGRAIDRYPVRPLLSVLALGQIAALSLAAFAMGWSMVATSVLLMVMVFGQVPVAATLIARYTPNQLRARIYGLQYLLTFGVGASAVPLISVLHSITGFHGFFLVMAGLAGLVLLIAQALPDTRL